MMKSTVVENVDYGPLAQLIGTWKGEQGEDLAPEPDGDARSPYFEVLTFEPAGSLTNAEEQTLSALQYRQIVSRKSDRNVFHNQVGYSLWDPKTRIIVQTITIPRIVTLFAGGSATTENDGKTVFRVMAEENHAEWGILQSNFMKQKACTKRFTHMLTVKGNELYYRETTLIDIYGKKNFEHVDFNTLSKEIGLHS